MRNILLSLILLQSLFGSDIPSSLLNNPFIWSNIELSTTNADSFAKANIKADFYNYLMECSFCTKPKVNCFHLIKLSNEKQPLIIFNHFFNNDYMSLIVWQHDKGAYSKALNHIGEIINLKIKDNKLYIKLYQSACCEENIESDISLLFDIDTHLLDTLELSVFQKEDFPRFIPGKIEDKPINIDKTINLYPSYTTYLSQIKGLNFDSFLVQRNTKGLIIAKKPIKSGLRNCLVKIPVKLKGNNKITHIIGYIRQTDFTYK